MKEEIAGLRRNYSQKDLSEDKVNKDPIQQFQQWWTEAVAAEIIEPNAMTLATSAMDAVPSARIVLMKDFSENGFVFFTNYNSYKGQQISENPKACLLFFWKELERQVRITGLVVKSNAKDSDEYFHSRPEASQIGAWTSPQSQVIESRKWLDEEFLKKENELKGKMQRPPH